MPLFRQEAFTLAAGLRRLNGIEYAEGMGGEQFLRRSLDKLAEVALRTKAITEPRFVNVPALITLSPSNSDSPNKPHKPSDPKS